MMGKIPRLGNALEGGGMVLVLSDWCLGAPCAEGLSCIVLVQEL